MGLSDLPRPGAPLRYDHDKRVEVFKTRLRARSRTPVNPYGGAYRGRDAIVENVFGPILAETEQRDRGVRPDLASRARALRWAGGARILDRAHDHAE